MVEGGSQSSFCTWSVLAYVNGDGCACDRIDQNPTYAAAWRLVYTSRWGAWHFGSTYKGKRGNAFQYELKRDVATHPQYLLFLWQWLFPESSRTSLLLFCHITLSTKGTLWASFSLSKLLLKHSLHVWQQLHIKVFHLFSFSFYE